MSRFSDPLSRVRVASPCPADWDKMIGDERVRFCGQCELNVYNLSAMTRTQAEDLIAGTERRLCIRYYRRKDGSILTRLCCRPGATKAAYVADSTRRYGGTPGVF